MVVVLVKVVVLVVVVVVVLLLLLVVSNNNSSSSRSRVTAKDASVYVHVAYLFMRASIYAQIYNARSRLSLHVLLAN
jgi:type II secretory pathway pseudopilin PulG